MTNKLLLEQIYKEQKEQAQKQLQLSADFSTYINKTDLQLNEILNYLESNSKTNTKGAIEQIKENKDSIAEFRTDKKIVYTIGVVTTLLFNFIFKYFWK